MDYIIKNKEANDVFSIEIERENKEQAKERLVILIRALIGTRSIRKTAEESHVTAAYLTNILKKKNLPSATILRKLSDPSANPQNGVTFEELMAAAGNRTYNPTMADNESELRNGNYLSYISDSKVKNGASAGDESRQNASSEMFRRGTYENTVIVRGIIVNALIQKGISFHVNNCLEWSKETERLMNIFVDDSVMQEWSFEYFRSSGDIDTENMRMIFEVMKRPSVKERKTSIITEKKEQFKKLIQYKDKIAYRGDLSVILIDIPKMRALKEVYVSHYEAEGPYEDYKLI